MMHISCQIKEEALVCLIDIRKMYQLYKIVVYVVTRCCTFCLFIRVEICKLYTLKTINLQDIKS